MPFSTLPSVIAQALAERGYADATPVQAEVLKSEAHDRDMLVSAQTGSGKTVAFGLALAQTLLGDAEKFGPAREPLALIIAPTRELALQVQRELAWLFSKTNARVASCVGGMDMRREQRALSQGVHIVVGTPGRLRDHLERGSLVTSQLRAVVLDEADEMLDLGFRDDLEEILDATPPERRTLMFSATLPKPIVTLAKRFQRDAYRITTISGDKPHGDIEYRAIRLAPGDIEHALVNVLRFFEANGAMIFCSTREGVRRLHASLVERGFSAVALSGELSQNERSHALQALRDRRARVCVATDVAARGIDLPDLGLVIHADLPNDAESLQHRSGRTGRAGKKGICILLVPYPKRRRAEGMLRTAHVNVQWMSPPTIDEIRVRDQERLLEALQAPEDANEDDLVVARQLLEQRGAEEIAAALVRMYRQRLPEPEELFDNGSDQRGSDNRGPDQRRPMRDEGPRPGFEDTIWFRMNVGRSNNADPRWLLPLLCRRGHITKNEVGAIRIFDRETRFEIPRAIASKFTAALSRSGEDDDGVQIEHLPEGAGMPQRAAHRPRPTHGPGQGHGQGRPPYAGAGRPGKRPPPRRGN